jgi:hypothetical protein
MLLSREVLPDFAILYFSMCCISFIGRVFWQHPLCGISGVLHEPSWSGEDNKAIKVVAPEIIS